MKWLSKGITISESASHKGMFILDDGEGKFWNIHSTQEQMVKAHPVDRILDARAVVHRRPFEAELVYGYLRAVAALLVVTILLGACNQKLYSGMKRRTPNANYK